MIWLRVWYVGTFCNEPRLLDKLLKSNFLFSVFAWPDKMWLTDSLMARNMCNIYYYNRGKTRNFDLKLNSTIGVPNNLSKQRYYKNNYGKNSSRA